jgi:hypothetical protein
MEMQIAFLTAASRALAKITKRTEGPLRLQRQDAEKLLRAAMSLSFPKKCWLQCGARPRRAASTFVSMFGGA